MCLELVIGKDTLAQPYERAEAKDNPERQTQPFMSRCSFNLHSLICTAQLRE